MDECYKPHPGICVTTYAPLSHSGDGVAGPRCLQLYWDACDAILGGPCQGLKAVTLPYVPATATTPAQPARSLLYVEKWTGSFQSFVEQALTTNGVWSSETIIPSDSIHAYLVESEFRYGYKVIGATCAPELQAQVVVNGATTGWFPSTGVVQRSAQPGETVAIQWRWVGDPSCIGIVDVTGRAIETRQIVVDCGLPSAQICVPTATGDGGGNSDGSVSSAGCGLSLVGGALSLDANSISAGSVSTSLQALGTCGLMVMIDGTSIIRGGTGALQVGAVPAANVSGLCTAVQSCFTAGPLISVAGGVIGLTSGAPGEIVGMTGTGPGWLNLCSLLAAFPSGTAVRTFGVDASGACVSSVVVSACDQLKAAPASATAIELFGVDAVGVCVRVPFPVPPSICSQISALPMGAATTLVGIDAAGNCVRIATPVGVDVCASLASFPVGTPVSVVGFDASGACVKGPLASTVDFCAGLVAAIGATLPTPLLLTDTLLAVDANGDCVPRFKDDSSCPVQVKDWDFPCDIGTYGQPLYWDAAAGGLRTAPEQGTILGYGAFGFGDPDLHSTMTVQNIWCDGLQVETTAEFRIALAALTLDPSIHWRRDAQYTRAGLTVASHSLYLATANVGTTPGPIATQSSPPYIHFLTSGATETYGARLVEISYAGPTTITRQAFCNMSVHAHTI